MEFRKAELNDLPEIFRMYKAAIRRMEEAGIFQWDEIYPSDELKEDIENSEMYVAVIDGVITAAFTLNQKCDESYESCDWKFGGKKIAILHRMCVNPEFQNMGVATAAGKYIDEFLRDRGFDVFRLDTFSKNHAALRLYEKLGFVKAGETNFRKGLFYLYEKKL